MANSFNDKMTAIAEGVRTLSGASGKLGLDSLASNINSSNTEIENQSELLASAIAALEGKAAGGGVELPTLSNPASTSDILSGKEAINSSGKKITGTIATKTSSNLTASGATVTVPAGYYASNASKAISSGSAKTPATTVTKNPTISINASGLITASVSGSQNVTPTVTAGYVSSGTAGTITVSGSATKQLTTKAATTITPTTSSQTAVAKNVYTTGAVTVAAIPSDYIVTDEITAQDSLISQIQTALQGKAAGGGGSIETCTVTVTGSTIRTIAYTSSNGAVYLTDTSNLVFNNVVKNSAFILYGATQIPNVTTTGSIECLGYPGSASWKIFVFSVTGDGTITIIDDD